MTTPQQWCRRVAALVVTAALSGCATTQGNGAASSADPFEPFNRAMYAIHEPIDDNIVRPMAQAWVDYVPSPVRHAVRTFFGNIEDAWNSPQFEAFRNILRNACPACPTRDVCMGGCPLHPEIVLCGQIHRAGFAGFH